MRIFFSVLQSAIEDIYFFIADLSIKEGQTSFLNEVSWSQ